MEHIMLYIRRILFMVRKEMLTTLKDPKSRIILIMPVIIQSLLFGYVASYNLDSVDYAVLDLSRSRYSEELLAELDGSGIFKRVATLGSTSQIARFIDGREAGVVLVIGHDFADKITAGETAPVQVITDGRNTMTSGIAAGYISAVAAAYNSRLHGGHQLLHIDPVAWYNPNLISRWGVPRIAPSHGQPDTGNDPCGAVRSEGKGKRYFRPAHGDAAPSHGNTHRKSGTAAPYRYGPVLHRIVDCCHMV